MREFLIRLSLCAVLACSASAQNLLHLKNILERDSGEEAEAARGFTPPLSLSGDRIHVLAQFHQALTAEQIRELDSCGAHVVQYVPDLGYILSVSRGLTPEKTGLKRLVRFRPQVKISSALKQEGGVLSQGYLVAEFFPDVDPEITRQVAEASGFEVLAHPDLLPNHLLLRGPAEAIEGLAQWDEVAYLFPASTDLEAGEHVEACPGAITDLGPVGQYVATVGDGWDGKGKGSAELGYFFQQLTQKLPADQVRSEILRAVGEWARVASLSFQPAASFDSPRTLNMLFASGSHGDAYPFDGPGHVLAHTYYPAPPNPESIAGDLHFDADEAWVAGTDITVNSVDLFSVALHELGHALGLGHSDNPGAVMYPYYRRVTALTQEDINAILGLYAAAGTTPSGQPSPATPLTVVIGSPSVFPLTTTSATVSFTGAVTGGTGDVRVSWSSDQMGTGVAWGGRTWTITSLPLQLGSNTITITATDAASGQGSRTVSIVRQEASQAPPSISISSPTSGATYATGSPSVILAGTASPAGGIMRVQWSNSRGGSGAASGTSQWSAGPITLQAGANVLTVTAVDARGASASRAVTVTYASGADTVAPSLAITSPASTSVLTTAASIRLQGWASDNVGVVQVTWSTAFGRSGVAAGTSSWNTGDVPLLVGTNTIMVRAYDAAGNSAWRSVTVTRR
jgi:hypothetical protein